MNEKLEMAKNSLYNANEIKDIKENPVVESVLLAPIKAIPVSYTHLDVYKRQDKFLAGYGDLFPTPLVFVIFSGKSNCRF